MCVSAAQLNTACIVLAGTLCSTQCQPDGKTVFHTLAIRHQFALRMNSNTRGRIFFFFFFCVHPIRTQIHWVTMWVTHALSGKGAFH